MDHGPVLSQVYNLIKGEDILTPQWERYIRSVNHRYLQLEEDPGVGKLDAQRDRQAARNLHAI